MGRLLKLLAVLALCSGIAWGCSCGTGGTMVKGAGTNAPGTVDDETAPGAGSDPLKHSGAPEGIPRVRSLTPPIIPHDIAGMVIRTDEHPCLGCHAEGVGGAPKIPDSHYLNPSSGAKWDDIHKARWVCTFCHVTQTGLKPAVENNGGE